jgi:hypothetical protein
MGFKKVSKTNQVHNRLDSREYAVKKVRLNESRPELLAKVRSHGLPDQCLTSDRRGIPVVWLDAIGRTPNLHPRVAHVRSARKPHVASL